MDTCPACGAPIDAHDKRCPSCDLALEGATASFEPIEATAESPEAGEFGATEVPSLVVRKGAEVGEHFYLDRPEISIGRDPSSDIFLNDVTVSRAHARLSITGPEVRVEDAGSLNGTYVNNVLVDSAILRHGDALQIGRFQMVFLSRGGP